MQRIRINHLEPGRAFRESLFCRSGQKLIGPNIPLTQSHIRAIRRSGETEVFSAQNLEELVAAGLVHRVDQSRLALGQKAQEGLLTGAGQVLLEEGEQIEEHHLDALRASGGVFQSVRTLPSDRRERILLADALVEELEQEVRGMPFRIRPATDNSWIHEEDERAWPALSELTRQRNHAVDTLRQLYARIEAGVTVPLQSFDPMLEHLMEGVSHHPRQFTQLALLCPRREDYLPDHAYTAAVLAMAIAANLNWPRSDVREVGLTGLLFDLGMLMIPHRIRVGGCELSDIDRSRVQRHPIFSLAMLQAVGEAPLIARYAALQHHERENSSGYPRARRREAICDYARVIAVADSYAATTEPRHYRRPKMPYVAMEEALRSASAMVFWPPAVRALVRAAGLFPVGSYVKLSSGDNAHVIASNPDQVDRPIVQPLDHDGQIKGGPIDLGMMDKQTLAVVRSVQSAKG